MCSPVRLLQAQPVSARSPTTCCTALSRQSRAFGHVGDRKILDVLCCQCSPKPVWRYQMRRREFITLLGGAAAGWPLAARAQQPERMRRIGILLPAAADDAALQVSVGAFLQELALLGWTIGRNVRIDTRWAGVNASAIRRHAVELATLAPDVILANAN